MNGEELSLMARTADWLWPGGLLWIGLAVLIVTFLPRWRSIWSAREGGEAIALFRMAMGLCVVLTVGGVVRADLVEVIWYSNDFGGFMPIKKGNHLIQLLGGPTPEVVGGVIWAAVISGFLLMIGFGGRLTALVANQTYLALSTLNGHAGGSYEPFLVNGLWLLVLASSTATWSVDSLIRHRAWSSGREVYAWPRYLALVQLIVVYSSTGLQKVASVWTPVGGFSAIYYVLFDWTWIKYPALMQVAPWVYPFLQLNTAMVWLFEVSWVLMPLWLWYRWKPEVEDEPRLQRLARRYDVRAVMTAFGISMHLGIWLLMEVATFSIITLSFYIALWKPSEVVAGLRYLKERAPGFGAVQRRVEA